MLRIIRDDEVRLKRWWNTYNDRLDELKARVDALHVLGGERDYVQRRRLGFGWLRRFGSWSALLRRNKK